MLLKSGCVCCTIRGDLKEALLRLHGAAASAARCRRSRGWSIETTGLADPAPIVATLDADPMLRHHFRMGNIVTVGRRGERRGQLCDASPNARRQVAVADRLVISKTDLAAGDAVAALRSRLAALNPTAEIVETGEEDAAAASLVTQRRPRRGRLVCRRCAVGSPRTQRRRPSPTTAPHRSQPARRRY